MASEADWFFWISIGVTSEAGHRPWSGLPTNSKRRTPPGFRKDVTLLISTPGGLRT